jgi:phage gp16-like protein
MLQDGHHMMRGKVVDKKAEQKEETVDDLLHKLAKKGKKVKLLDESASIKDLKRDSVNKMDDDENFDRDGDNIDV